MSTIWLMCSRCKVVFQAVRGARDICPGCAASGWYYACGKEKKGPVTQAQLQQLAAAGQLQPTDMVLPEGCKTWMPAQGVPGLFGDVMTIDRPVSVAPPSSSIPAMSSVRSPASAGPLPTPDTVNDPQRTGPYRPPLDSKNDPTHAVDVLPVPSVAGYEILAVLGRGGMGVVYKARHLQLKRLVALKMILAGEHAGGRELARFRGEAEAVARLQHPNIVQIYEIGDQDGRPYLALEFVDGGSLARKLAGTPLPARSAAHLVETLARAMDVAHRQGIVHRDLKPGNVLLVSPHPPSPPPPLRGEGGEKASISPPPSVGEGPGVGGLVPKIADFGLAKQLDEDAGQTGTRAVMGTPSYMAPEQAAGQSKTVGPAADVYALGAILYETLTGRPPFKAATALETLEQVRGQEPVPPSQLQPKVPRDLETICLKCLEKEPGKRYASALELADDLNRYLSDKPIVAVPAGMLDKFVKYTRRNKAVVAALGGILAALVLGLIGLWVGMLQAQASEARAQKNLIKTHLQASEIAMRRGAWRETLESCDKAIQAGHPDIVGLRLNKIRAWSALNENLKAASEIEELARQKDLGKHEAEVLLFQGDLALGVDNDKAVELIRKALARGLLPADKAYARGLLAKTSPEAVKHYAAALERDRFHQQAYTMLTLTLVMLGRLDEAGQRASAAEVLFPEDPNFKLARAVIRALRGDLPGALALVERTRSQLGDEQAAILRTVVELLDEGHDLERQIGLEREPVPLTLITKLAPHLNRFLSGAGRGLGGGSLAGVGRLLRGPPLIDKGMKHFAAAVLALALGTADDKVIAEVSTALKAHPEGTLHYARACLLYYVKNDLAGAEAAFLVAARTPAIFAVRRVALQGALLCEARLLPPKDQKPDPDLLRRAVRNLRELLGLRSVRLMEAEVYAKIALRAREFGLARDIVVEWLRLSPGNLGALQARVELEFESGAYFLAVQAADKVLDKQAGNLAAARYRQEALEKIRALLKKVDTDK